MLTIVKDIPQMHHGSDGKPSSHLKLVLEVSRSSDVIHACCGYTKTLQYATYLTSVGGYRGYFMHALKIWEYSAQGAMDMVVPSSSPRVYYGTQWYFKLVLSFCQYAVVFYSAAVGQI